MKIALVLVVKLLLAAMVCMAGCSDRQVAHGHQEALYVRDKSNHCELYSQTRAHREWDSYTHKITETKPYSVWRCDDYVFIIVHAGDEQP